MASDEANLMEDVDTFLRDQGLLEDEMNWNQKYEIYKILQISKQTALEEEKQRRFERPTEDRDILWEETGHRSGGTQQRLDSSRNSAGSSSTRHHSKQHTPAGKIHESSSFHGTSTALVPHNSAIAKSPADFHSLSEPHEPPTRTRRKKNQNKHDSPPVLNEIQIDLLPCDLVLPEYLANFGKNRFNIAEENSDTGNSVLSSVIVPKTSLFLGPDEDENRGFARIDSSLEACCNVTSNSDSSTASSLPQEGHSQSLV